MADQQPGRYRIGALSRRVGVSEHVLRAWERRYGLLRPERSEGGYRLYSLADEDRVRRVRRLVDEGLSVAEAARAVLEEPEVGPGPPRAEPAAIQDCRRRLTAAIDALSEPEAEKALDDLLATASLETALREVVLPCLHDLGTRWERGEPVVAQEHFATAVIRGRLSAAARGWGRGRGPRVLLACPPGEQHDIALLAFGLVLGRHGWAVTFLGADTPIASLLDALPRTRPDVVVLAASDDARFTAVREELRTLAGRVRVLLAGPAATGRLAESIGAEVITGDPVAAARALAS